MTASRRHKRNSHFLKNFKLNPGIFVSYLIVGELRAGVPYLNADTDQVVMLFEHCKAVRTDNPLGYD